MKLKPSIVLGVVLASSGFFLAAPQLCMAANLPATWEQVKADALRFNSKPQAIDADLEAQSALTDVVRQGRKPRIGLDLSISQNRGRSRSDGDTSNSRSRSARAGLSLSWTIFQCGLRDMRIEAAEIEERISKHQYNSTKFFINNTKGTVVAQSFQAYSSVLHAKETLTLFPFYKTFLKILSRVANQSENTAQDVRLAMTSVENSAQFAEQDLDAAEDVFVYWVTKEPSPDMVTLQEGIEELAIPDTAEEAYEISLRQSPDILQALEQIKAAELQIKIAETAFCPTVSLSTGISTNRFRDQENSSSSRGLNGDVGIFVDIPIYDPSASAQIEYQKKALVARRLSQQSAFEDARFELEQTYKTLGFQLENQLRYQSVVSEMRALMAETIEDIENNRNLPDLSDEGAIKDWVGQRLGYLSRLRNNWFQLNFTKLTVLNSKFSVQQTTGELFNDEMRARLASEAWQANQ